MLKLRYLHHKRSLRTTSQQGNEHSLSIYFWCVAVGFLFFALFVHHTAPSKVFTSWMSLTFGLMATAAGMVSRLKGK